MSGSTINTTIFAGVTLGSGAYGSPLTITSTGAIAPAASGATALVVATGAGEALNQGTITGGPGGGTGISLSAGTIINGGLVSDGGGVAGIAVTIAGGGFTNSASGTILGGNRLYPQTGIGVTQTGGVLLNEGMIASGGSHGVYGVVITGADLTNATTGTITGAGGVLQSGGSTLNDGNINAGYSAGDGVYLKGDGSFSNAGQVTGGHGNTGVTAGIGIYVAAGGTLGNSGTIIGGADYVVQLNPTPHGGTTGGDGVKIAGVSNFTNSGVITGGEGNAAGGGGVSLISGVLLNLGLITGGVGNSEYGNTVGVGYGGFGVDIAGMLINQGTIIGGMSGDEGISGVGVIIESGTVINNGLILGGYSSVIFAAPPLAGKAIIAEAGADVVNNGTIVANDTRYGVLGATAVYAVGGGTITNLGVIHAGSTELSFLAGDGIEAHAGEQVFNAGSIIGGNAAGTYQVGGFGVLLFAGGTVINSGYIAAGVGGAGDAVYFGSTASRLILDAGSRFAGSVVAAASFGNVLELGTATPGMLGVLDMGGSFSGFGNIQFDAGATWSLGGEAAEIAAGQTISGFAAGDTIILDGFTETSFSYVSNAGVELSNGTSFETLDITGSFTTDSFLVSTVANGTEIEIVCYLRGTKISTPAGEIPIEDLDIGDAVITRDHGYQKIKWIGRQSFGRRFIANNPEQFPVCIQRHALGPNQPSRDLFVSPGHSMRLGGIFVLAKTLVNGVTITQSEAPEEIHYYQIELAMHDCVLADGAWSESYADVPGYRGKFHNIAEFYRLYPDYVEPAASNMCLARPEFGAELEAALRPIVARAAAAARATGLARGGLQGWIDHARGGLLEGWAIDTALANLPVMLEVVCGDRVFGTMLACGYREDLEQARLAQGWCAYRFTLPLALTLNERQNLRVRRVSDGATLAMTEACKSELGVPADRRRRAA